MQIIIIKLPSVIILKIIKVEDRTEKMDYLENQDKLEVVFMERLWREEI
jgi:hypothetical protein